MTKGATEVYIFNFLYAIGGIIVGLFIAWLVYWYFDKATPEFKIGEELKNGNMAVAVAIGCLFIMIGLLVGLIIGLSLN